jgi:hypothetical protein
MIPESLYRPPPEVTTTPSEPGHPDNLWKTIQRLDTTIGATNSKSALLIAYNTFVIGTILLRWPLLPAGIAHGTAVAGGFLLALILLVSVLSLVATFLAARPFLGSPRNPNGYHSLLFCGHICEHANEHAYLQSLRSPSTPLQEDLAFQIHALAGATYSKCRRLKQSIDLVVFAQMPAIALFAMLRLSLLIYKT